MPIQRALKIFLAVAALALSAPANAAPFAYVSNANDNTVSVIDIAINAVVATVPVGSSPFGVAVHAGIGRAYVANSASNTVSVIDTASNMVVATVPVGSTPAGIAVDSAGARVYVVCTGSNAVYVIDTATNTYFSPATQVGSGADGIAVTPDGSRAYVTNNTAGTVSVIDAATRAVTSTITIGQFPAGIAINSAGTRAYVGRQIHNVVTVIDITTNTVLTDVNVIANTVGIAVNPAGTRVYVGNFSGNDVSVIDATSNTFLGTVTVGNKPFGISFDPGGGRAYVANFDTNTVTVIDVGTSMPITAIDVGSGPRAWGVFIDPAAASGIKTTPSISLGSSPNPSAAGQMVDITAMVSGPSGTPTGTIVFQDNGVAISGCAGLAMTNGSATCSPSMLSAGTHPITAVYSGDSAYDGITSSTLQQTVNGATATVSLGTSQNPSAVGANVTFTASVTGEQDTPTGTVDFLDGASAICSMVMLSSGSAACSTMNLALGTHSISAAYSGNSTYNASTSGTLSQMVVNPGTPSITLGSTANPSTVGQYVTYTAVVSGSSGTPTGTIVFSDDGAVINGCGGLAMTNGRATCTIGNQAMGTHSMTAVYSGDGLYSGITSSTLPQVVNAAKANTPSITLGSSVNPSTVGQYVELTAVLSGGAGTPTGTLVFLDNGDTISGCGGLAMTGGQATCTPGNLTQGTHSITTVYSGNGTYNGVTSSTLPQTVNAAKANTPSFTLATSQNPSTAGQPVTFTAVLSGAAGTVTGNVVFRDNGLTISGCGGLALTAGHVTCAPRLSAGAHAITGIYLGDANYNGITSSTVPQTAQ